MNETPKSMRLQIGIFGRTNVGKSSFLNMVAGQKISITSEIPGTTTDVVEKPMELLPIGPVVFLDTAGINDESALSRERMEKTYKIFSRADIIVLITEPGIFGLYENEIAEQAGKNSIPIIILVNKIDIFQPDEIFISQLKKVTGHVLFCNALDFKNRDKYVNEFKRCLQEILPEDFLSPPALTGDIMPKGGVAVLIVPIDMEAPRGRIILPQVQTVRDILDSDSCAIVIKENEYPGMLKRLNSHPDLVICDSQVVDKMVKDTPREVKCTTFSILFARFKGDLQELSRGLAVIDKLRAGDKVLIAESCTHHALQDDIGRVKIPKWLARYTGIELTIDVAAGRDYPANLKDYKLVIHCGSCMLTRREMLHRIGAARKAGVYITNYGLCISYLHGVLERVLSPFHKALEAFENERKRLTDKISK